MADKRDLSLAPRKENLRDAQVITPPVQFSLCEIKQHFLESIESIKAQYEVADSLAAKNDIGGCKTIWRSQVVLAEGMLDFYIREILLKIGNAATVTSMIEFVVKQSNISHASEMNIAFHSFFRC